MKRYSKVHYQTKEGNRFKTFAPVLEMNAFDYMMAKYGTSIQVVKITPSVKSGYKKFVNIQVK